MRKLQKLFSLLMVVAMLSMLIPVSAFAAAEDLTKQESDGELSLVLVTTGVTAENDRVPAETLSDPERPQQPVADEMLLPAQVDLETNSDSEQSKTPAVEPETAAVEPEAMETQTATYLCLTQNGVIIDVLATNIGSDYSYDAAVNELTLNNFVGETLDVKSAVTPFKLILMGTNVLKTDNGFAIDIEGDANLSGTGTLVAEGQTTEKLMGGGINTLGNLTIDSGTYNIAAVGGENTDSSSAVGILTGYNDGDNIIAGDLTINGGNIDVTAYNKQLSGAFGLFAYGDLVVNNGNINVFTDSPTSYSRGIGAYDQLVFNGGHTVVKSIAENGDAGAIFSYNKIVINNGILDLYSSGAIAKALVFVNGIDIGPNYGEVNRDAASLYLEPLASKTFEKSQASSVNPKTGADTSTSNAAVAGAALLLLIGFAYVLRLQEVNA